MFTISSSTAQHNSSKVELVWGSEHKESKTYSLRDIVGYDETGFYALKTKINSVFNKKTSTVRIQHFDHDVNELRSADVILTLDGRAMDFQSIVQINDGLLLFSSQVNSKLGKNALYVQSVDKKTLRTDKKIKVAELNILKGSGLVKSANTKTGGFDIKLSRDSSKLMIYYNVPSRTKENEEYGFHVFDKSLNKIWEKKFVLPYSQELFEVVNHKVDKNGNVYLLGKLYNKIKKNRRKGEANFKYLVISYKKEGTEIKEYPIDLGGHFLTDMQIAINDNQDIICGGFYSELGTYSVKGSYFLKIDGETARVESTNFKEFQIDFITQNMKRGEESKARKQEVKGKNVELSNYQLSDIIIKDNGGAILIGEQFFVTTYTGTSSDGSRYTVSKYFYNDIIVINISSSGQIEWAEKIAKSQRTTNDGGIFSSYALAVAKNKLYFVFNDHPANLSEERKGIVHTFTRSKKTIVVLVEMDGSGNQKREALVSSGDTNMLTKPIVCEQISSSEMILFSQRKKIQSFAKMIFR